MDFDTLAARALNASRTIHKPTYAGLRVLLGSLAKSKGTFEAFLTRRCLARESWRYFGFQILKEASATKKPTYRNCIVGSPLTMLAEAYVLGLMAEAPAFSVPPCAYSYLWPQESMAGRNFEYFFEGYDRRNRVVGQLLMEHPDAVAVVTDIKSFYPSVRKDRLRSKVEGRIRQIGDPSARRSIERFILGMLELKSPRTTGLPIGPDLSHALGHVALESVDAALVEAFGDRYLRYVDDIIVVAPKSEVRATLTKLRQALAEEGLSLNKSKQDEVEAATWHRENLSISPVEDSPAFEALVDDITLYLIHHPKQADELQQRFREAGFSLPIGRWRSMALSKRFRAHFGRKMSGLGGTLKWFRSWFTTQASLLDQARTAREALFAKAEELAEEQLPQSPTRRRWYVQKRRYVLNRLLYLFAPSDYGKLLALTPDIDEFFENRLVLEALATQDCSKALAYPGRVVTSICQLWPEHRPGIQPHIAWPSSPDRAEAESAAHFALFLSVLPPEAVLRSIDSRTPGGRILIEMCGRGYADRGRIEQQTYLDEMEYLYQSLPHEDVVRLMSSRFDELEEIGLDALLLGTPTYLVPGDIPLFSG